MYLLSDSITDDDRHLYGELAIRILDLLALWDRLLDCMYWIVAERRAVNARSVQLTTGQASLRKLRDLELARMVLTAAEREHVSGDRGNFLAAFRRVQAVRHHVAHAMAMNAMTTETHQPRIGIPHYADNPRLGALDGGQSTITQKLMEKRLRDVNWLLEHVDWIRLSLNQSGGPIVVEPTLTAAPPAAPKH